MKNTLLVYTHTHTHTHGHNDIRLLIKLFPRHMYAFLEDDELILNMYKMFM